ncbi:hypothetical protein FLK61_33510 [Paenalkalicoccus suaedae]|uniref:Uncharacterized protein n=2 Tax=Paenalkalicoccus suaedae TaxID=2592382 RepID=A0A859FKF1_9BACI|nr:hypothetical protein [Paenalkalicoccus suaedae]QKS73263.1 hypothetical protein FLK61_33510 [Paenalkalicoccus suaedae]
MSRYHCCATCTHFQIKKSPNGMISMCKRLGFETKTDYQFDCWVPREDIKRKMEKESENY